MLERIGEETPGSSVRSGAGKQVQQVEGPAECEQEELRQEESAQMHETEKHLPEEQAAQAPHPNNFVDQPQQADAPHEAQAEETDKQRQQEAAPQAAQAEVPEQPESARMGQTDQMQEGMQAGKFSQVHTLAEDLKENPQQDEAFQAPQADETQEQHPCYEVPQTPQTEDAAETCGVGTSEEQPQPNQALQAGHTEVVWHAYRRQTPDLAQKEQQPAQEEASPASQTEHFQEPPLQEEVSQAPRPEEQEEQGSLLQVAAPVSEIWPLPDPTRVPHTESSREQAEETTLETIMECSDEHEHKSTARTADGLHPCANVQGEATACARTEAASAESSDSEQSDSESESESESEESEEESTQESHQDHEQGAKREDVEDDLQEEDEEEDEEDDDEVDEEPVAEEKVAEGQEHSEVQLEEAKEEADETSLDETPNKDSAQLGDTLSPPASSRLSGSPGMQEHMSETSIWRNNILGRQSVAMPPLPTCVGTTSASSSARRRASSESGKSSARPAQLPPPDFSRPSFAARRGLPGKPQEVDGSDALTSLRASAKELARAKLHAMRHAQENSSAIPMPAGPKPDEAMRFGAPAPPPINYRLGARAGYKGGDAWEYEKIERNSQKLPPTMTKTDARKQGRASQGSLAAYNGRLAPQRAASSNAMAKSASLPTLGSARMGQLRAQKEAAHVLHGSPQRMVDVR